MQRSSLCRRHPLIGFALAALLTASLAACNGGDSGTPSGAKPTRSSGAAAAATIPAGRTADVPTVRPTPTDAPFSFGWFTQQDLEGDWLIIADNARMISIDCATQQEDTTQSDEELAQVAQYVSILSVYSAIGGTFESSGRGQYRFVLDENSDFADELAESDMPTLFAGEIGYDGSAIVATQALTIPMGDSGTAPIVLAAAALPLGLAAWALRRKRQFALPLIGVLLLTQLTGCVGFYGGISSRTTFNRIEEGRRNGEFTPLLELSDGSGSLVFDLTIVTEEVPEDAPEGTPAERVEDTCRIEVGYDARAALFADGVVTKASLPQLVEAGYLPVGVTGMFGDDQ